MMLRSGAGHVVSATVLAAVLVTRSRLGGGMTNHHPRDPFVASAEDAIRRHGIAYTSVLGDQHHPAYTYSIGGCIRGRPEVVLVGRERDDVLDVLDHVTHCMLPGPPPPDGWAGHRFGGGEYLLLPVPEHHFTDLDGLLLGIPHVCDALGWPAPPEVLQIVWADAEGRFPWDDGVDPMSHRDQIVLAAGGPCRRRTPLAEPVDNSDRCPACGAERHGHPVGNRAARRAAARATRRSRPR